MEWNLRSDRNIRDHLVQPFNMKAKEPYTSGVLGFACSPLVKKKEMRCFLLLRCLRIYWIQWVASYIGILSIFRLFGSFYGI